MELNIRAGSASREPLLSHRQEWLTRWRLKIRRTCRPRLAASWWVWTWAAVPIHERRVFRLGATPAELSPWDVFRPSPSLVGKRQSWTAAAGSYQLMRQRGELVQFGKNLTDVAAFLEEIREPALTGQEVLGLVDGSIPEAPKCWRPRKRPGYDGR